MSSFALWLGHTHKKSILEIFANVLCTLQTSSLCSQLFNILCASNVGTRDTQLTKTGRQQYVPGVTISTHRKLHTWCYILPPERNGLGLKYCVPVAPDWCIKCHATSVKLHADSWQILRERGSCVWVKTQFGVIAMGGLKVVFNLLLREVKVKWGNWVCTDD